LTTAEETDAEELRQETLVRDNERIEREQEEQDRRGPGGVAHHELFGEKRPGSAGHCARPRFMI
jgi:hypothetical protein